MRNKYGGASGGYTGYCCKWNDIQPWSNTKLEIDKVSNIPLLVLCRHSSFCNLPSTNLCVQTFTYNQGKLSSPIDWECGVRNDISC